MPPSLLTSDMPGAVRARADFERVCQNLDDSQRQHIERLAASSASPGQTLHYLAALLSRAPQAFDFLLAHPLHLRAATQVFSVSRFLSESCLEHPEWLTGLDDLDRARSAEQYAASLADEVNRASGGRVEPVVLARFRRRELLRILARDLLSLAGLAEITEEISGLADAVLEICYERFYADLAARHGEPHVEGVPCGMSVIALGKLGGRELNYSSDIDLMFVYGGNGDTEGPVSITNKEFFKKIANQFSELLSTYTVEGMCYRVDLRLRPDGSLGEVCLSLDGALKYYRTRARDWELQMMIKARVAAGDPGPGRKLLDAVEPLTYATTLDFSAIEAVSLTRERISEKLAARRHRNHGLDVKLAPGGIRDIEFLAQCLQRLHGARAPWVRHGGTLLALSRLSDKNLLSDSEHGRLAAAYRFLREVEHRLQAADDRQTHALVSDPAALDSLARGMPRTPGSPEPTGAQFLQDLNAHLEAVQEIYETVIHAQRPTYYALTPAPEQPRETPGWTAPARTTHLAGFLGTAAPAIASAVTRTPLKRGGPLFEHFLEGLQRHSSLLQELNSDSAAIRYLLDIFEHSPFFSEQLARTPDLVRELENLPDVSSDSTEVIEETIEEALDGASGLRKWYRREMFRIQAASICLSAPIFETLERTSDLADAAIRAAYRMAVEQTRIEHPPVRDGYKPRNQMMVIALGRLGMREFDLCSDADLVFALPERDQEEHVFWTRSANRMIDILTTYTGDGQLFSVDTRLRPNGSAGTLVQAESSFLDYFAKHAEAWEGISYMKARAVAGETERATGFLNSLQEVDWRRYGQSGRSRKDLRAMRMRLEKEQGPSNPLKAGPGGYYDIDFMLLYLRLKGAGIFFKVLNTPARIDVVEKMGHLERADAEFLRDAAALYRSIDHGLRVHDGHAAGNLPTNEVARETVAALVKRWTPEHLHQQPLETALTQMRHRTREIFDRLFQ